MSQLPQFQEKGLLENLVESELNKESVRARLLQTSSNPFERPGVDENLLPTFVQQESGFFDTIGQRFARGAAELEPLGGRRFLLESIPEMVADFNRSEQVPGPYLNNNSVFVIDNKQYDPADVRLDDILDNMPPEIEASLNIYGMNRDRLKELQISDGQKFADFYPALMQQIRVSQSLQAYNEQNPILAGVAGGTHFVSNIIADPLFIAGLLFTGGSTTAAREGTKQTSKGLIRASLKKAVDGPSSALLKKIAGDKAKQTILTRSLIVGGGAAAGGIYTTSADVAAQQYSMELGLIDPDLQTNYAALGIGLAAGGLLSEIAYRSATGAKILPVRKILSRNPESTGSLTTAHILAKEGTAAERLGRTKPLNESSDTIVAGDFVQSMVPELYDPDTSDAFVRFLLTDNNLADINMVKLADYMAQFPDADELLGVLTSPTTVSRELTPPELTNNLKKSGLKVGSGVVVGRTASDTSTVVSATVDEITELGLVKITTVFGETRLIKPNEITEFYPAGLPTSGELRTGTVKGITPTSTTKTSPLLSDEPLPRTKYQKLTDDVEFYDAQVKQFRQTRARKEEIKATRLRDKAKAARDTHIEESFNLKKTSLGDAIRRNMQDIPISAEMNATARIQMISNTLNNVLNERTENRSGIGVMSRFQHVSGKLGSKWLLPRQYIKADIGSDNKVQSLIGFMSGLIDNHGLDNAEVLRNADGQVITPASVRWQEMNDGGVHRVQRESDILKRSGYDMDEAYMQVGMHITKGDPLPKELLPLYKELKPYLDNIGRRGVAARTIDNINPNFMPVKIKQIFNHEVVKKAWTNVYVRKYLDIFNTSFSDSPVNYRALEKAKFIEKADGEWVSRISPLTNEPFFDAVPTKVGQLTPQMLEMYEPLLAQSIKLDAEESLARRIGKRNDELKDAPEGPLIRTSSISPLRSRVLLQEIYFDPEVVKSGLVETDIGLINRAYTKATGYNVARDEAMGELFGQPVKYQEVLDTLTALSSSNTDAVDALIRLKKLDERTSGRFVIDRDFAVLGTVLSNLGATLVAGTLAPTVLSTEIGAQFLRGVVSRGSLVDHVRLMGDAFKKVGNKERLRHLGIAHEAEMRSSRFWHDFSDHLPEDVAENLAVRATKSMAQISRKIFLEQPATHLAKATAHSLTFAKLHFSRKKFDKIRSGLDFLEANPDNFAGAARAAGLPLGEFRMLKDFGVINKDMLETAEALLEIDSGALFSDASLSKAITQVKNPKTRAKAQDLHNRISRMALVDAEVFVATPKAGDLAATDNAMFNLLVSMQSFGAAFYNNTLTRVGQAPGWKQAGFFGYLVAAEINNQIIREYLYEDKTMEDIRLEWEEAPIKKLAQAVSRVPVQGPFSLPALFGYAIASGRPELGVRGFGGGAVPNMVANSVKAIHDLGSSIYTGEPMTDSAKRNARRSAPLYNNWMLRLLEDSE